MKTPSQFRSTLLIIAAIALLAAAPARAADVNASLSARKAYVGAPITLQIEIANASAFDEPTLPDIAGLDIQAEGTPRRSTQTTIINGRRTDRTSAVHAWRLIPRREGAFVIPAIAIKIDGQTQSTQALRFTVKKSETGDLLFVDVTGQQQKIYVGQSLPLTLNIWIKPYRDAEHKLTVSEGDMWQMISDATKWGSFSGAITELAKKQQRPHGEKASRKDADGTEQSYYRYQVEATIYPKRPGQVDAGDVQVVVDYPTGLAESRDPFASMFDSDFFKSGSPFGARGFSPFDRKTLSVVASRPIVANATVSPIEVTPIPTAGRPADYRGAVGRYQIATHATPTSIKAGDPITLQIGISGDGPMDLVQAPPLAELPQLTADFKVSNEPLAGVVEQSTKVFTTSIRPRRAGITHVPAIPLSFFDPSAEKFVTVQSEPTAIQVAEADRLTLGSVVGATNAGGNRSEIPEQKPLQLDLSNSTGDAVVVSEKALGHWLLVLMLGIPPLVAFSLWAFKHRQQLISSFRGTARQHLHNALRSLNDATSPSAIAIAVKDYASYRIIISARQKTISASALTRCDIAAQLRTLGCEREAEQLDAVLARCEQAAYAGSADEQLVGLKTAAAILLRDLSMANLRAVACDQIRPGNCRNKLAIVCLLLAVLAVALPAVIAIGYRHNATANRIDVQSINEPTNPSTNKTDESSLLRNLTSKQRLTILNEANSAYDQGLKATLVDAATAKEEFFAAATKYQLLVDSGVRNGDLCCNLGNAYLQSGSRGRAIAYYERALLLNPSNTKTRNNLTAARLAIHQPPSSGDMEKTFSLGHMFRTVAGRIASFISPAIGVMLFAGTWVALWAAIVGGIYFPSRHWRYALIPTTCLLLMGTSLSGIITYIHHAQIPHGIVATPTAILRIAPGEAFPAIAKEPLTEGESLSVLQTRGPWLHVKSANGQTGWVASRQIERPT